MGNHPSSSSSSEGGGANNGGHHHHRSHSDQLPHSHASAQQGHHHHRRESSGGIRHLLRNNGALGLSKAELDARCQPSGLYPSCHWDPKQIRRLIGDGKLAARCKGTEEAASELDTECPICFLHYRTVNQTKCCQAYICTECYLQVRSPKDASASAAVCPFCNQKLGVTVAAVSAQAVRERKHEEQRVLEAQIRAKADTTTSSTKESSSSQSTTTANKKVGAGGSLPSLSQAPQNTAFGASLEQNERVALMRKRSGSNAGEAAAAAAPTAMTPAERRALEAEMKAQHHHPLAQRMQQEEAERRFQNDLNYRNSAQFQERSRQQARRLLRGSARRDWNRIVQAFESGTAGNAVQSLDDLVVLEAAIMLSSMEGGGAAEAEEENPDDFAARHARAGFPLARARVSGGADENLLSRNPHSSSSSSSTGARPSWMMPALMSEEEQLAMAIAASLEDSNSTTNNNNNDNTAEGASGGAAAEAEGAPPTSEDAAPSAALAVAHEDAASSAATMELHNTLSSTDEYHSNDNAIFTEAPLSAENSEAAGLPAFHHSHQESVSSAPETTNATASATLETAVAPVETLDAAVEEVKQPAVVPVAPTPPTTSPQSPPPPAALVAEEVAEAAATTPAASPELDVLPSTTLPSTLPAASVSASCSPSAAPVVMEQEEVLPTPTTG